MALGYGKPCPHCGAYLDPEERCNCQDIPAQQPENKTKDKQLLVIVSNGTVKTCTR